MSKEKYRNLLNITRVDPDLLEVKVQVYDGHTYIDAYVGCISISGKNKRVDKVVKLKKVIEYYRDFLVRVVTDKSLINFHKGRQISQSAALRVGQAEASRLTLGKDASLTKLEGIINDMFPKVDDSAELARAAEEALTNDDFEPKA